MTSEGTDPRLDWAAISRPADGESVCGDGHLVAPFPGGTLVAVIDGLGHGEEAAQAARAAIAVLESAPAVGVAELLERCHEALRRTRGAAVSVASIGTGELTWVGVGNVEMAVVDVAPETRPEHLLVQGGVVGQSVPRLRPRSIRFGPGALLAAATDGVPPGLASRLDRTVPPREAAARLLDGAGGRDDALVLVGRLRLEARA